jgi:toxin YoeB
MSAFQKSTNDPSFLKDLESLRTHARKLVPRVRRLAEECLKQPRTGIGNPEPLRGYGSHEVWSRRIDRRHRLIYEIKRDSIIFIRCYGHYDDH